MGNKVKKPNKYWWISFNLNSEEFNNFIAEASKIKAHCENDGTYAEISGAEKEYKKFKALCEKFSSEQWFLQSKPETHKGDERPPDFVIQVVNQDKIPARSK